MAKSLPFAERPTWQRVKDLQDQAFQLRFTVENALRMWDAMDKPAMRAAVERQLTDALARLKAATGATD